MQRQHLARAAKLLVVAPEDHAAFAGHHVLGGVEAEAAEVAEGPGLAAVVFGLDGVRAVLDDHGARGASEVSSGSMSHGRPAKWTGRSAFVRAVILRSTRRGTGSW